jgi:hypothetical protein
VPAVLVERTVTDPVGDWQFEEVDAVQMTGSSSLLYTSLSFTVSPNTVIQETYTSAFLLDTDQNPATGVPATGTAPITISGKQVSFRVPRRLLGYDDGNLNMVGLVGTWNGPTDFIPDSSHLIVER